MKKHNIHLKMIFSLLLLGNLFSISFAATTTQKGREIVDLLKDDGRTEPEIRQALTDLGYNANEYLGINTNSNIKVISNASSNSNSNTSSVGRNIINNLRKDGRTDEEIKESIRDLGYDPSAYFPSNNSSYSNQYSSANSSASVYTSRSCKPYTIEYISSINAYTSPNLNKKEYFVNEEYFKRYVDSKNVWNAECTQSNNRISTSYTDNSGSPDRFTAPNGKIYFIVSNNGQYTSNELSKAKNFSTINELKDYIRSRNPLISMGAQPSQIQPTQADILYQTVHGSATEETTTIPDDGNVSTGSMETSTSSNENINDENEQTESSTEKEEDVNVISSLRNQLFD